MNGWALVEMGTNIGLVGVIGFALATGFEWFHAKEIKLPKKSKKEVIENDNINNLRKKLEARS